MGKMRTKKQNRATRATRNGSTEDVIVNHASTPLRTPTGLSRLHTRLTRRKATPQRSKTDVFNSENADEEVREQGQKEKDGVLRIRSRTMLNPLYGANDMEDDEDEDYKTLVLMNDLDSSATLADSKSDLSAFT